MKSCLSEQELAKDKTDKTVIQDVDVIDAAEKNTTKYETTILWLNFTNIDTVYR